jgi:bifunctional N-acetylglucosamine-1-phosphate-uridyltransferase/glucosamine-1-phosphate-acetyltransferase GlmU-like protein
MPKIAKLRKNPVKRGENTHCTEMELEYMVEQLLSFFHKSIEKVKSIDIADAKNKEDRIKLQRFEQKFAERRAKCKSYKLKLKLKRREIDSLKTMLAKKDPRAIAASLKTLEDCKRQKEYYHTITDAIDQKMASTSLV